jgi:Eco57I restriction-modification methylase/TaqI-like C-terminal specificity domain
VWLNLLSAEPNGGFDAVIGNPPYVRQELLGDETKRALKADYAAFDGMADLYIYFYEQGLRLLRPGGRMSYVVTNKWLKAGYAEALRNLFATKGQVEFVADFGHAKHFFPDADVFPSVVVVRKPVQGEPGSADTQVCVIPRDAVPEKGLSAAVAVATYPLPRAHFTKESWTLEPPEVVALLEKIRRRGVPLAEYAGVKPLYGIKTGLNEAFLIDGSTRDQLVKDDPKCAEIIKPYLRGQDIERWRAPWKGLWMIFTRRGVHIASYPSLKTHLERFRIQLEPKPMGWKSTHPDEEWPGRKEGNYAWYEIQDSVDYWTAMEKPKILYGDIAWSAAFALDTSGLFSSNTGYFIPTGDPWILSVLNAPIGWWFSWRRAQHAKDEALRYFNTFMEDNPVAPAGNMYVSDLVADAARHTSIIEASSSAIHDWFRHEFGMEKIGRALTEPYTLNADTLIAAVRAGLPKSRKLSAAEIARIKQECAETLIPAREAAADILALERKLSDLVNAAYGLTPEEVALMWRTAPKRMPLDPTEELRRLALPS